MPSSANMNMSMFTLRYLRITRRCNEGVRCAGCVCRAVTDTSRLVTGYCANSTIFKHLESIKRFVLSYNKIGFCLKFCKNSLFFGLLSKICLTRNTNSIHKKRWEAVTRIIATEVQVFDRLCQSFPFWQMERDLDWNSLSLSHSLINF